MRTKKCTALALAVMLVCGLGTSGCSGSGNGDSDSEGMFELSRFDGMNLEEGYDTSLLYRNMTDFQGGDSGFIYVSEEEAAGLSVDNKEEYGGYFYQYCTAGGVHNRVPSTADGKTPSEKTGEAAYKAHVMITRSKDLNDWEPCGEVDNGLGLLVENDEWVLDQVWAPECIYDSATNKYYLYFSACSQINDGVAVNGIKKLYSSSTATFDRFYLGVAVSDTPAGPFRLVTSENVYGNASAKNPNGEVVTSVNPAIMIDKECDDYFYTDAYRKRGDFAEKDEVFAAIDIHPVFLNGELYIYFVKHISTGNIDGNTVWGMKMKDMITPDYSTISMLVPGYMKAEAENELFQGETGKEFVRVTYRGETENDPNYPRHLQTSWTRYTYYEDGTQRENSPNGNSATIVEGPQMLTTTDKDGKTVYILTYAVRGVDNYYYDVQMAYSYDPLGGFVKPTEEQGATVLGVDKEANNFMSNLGHVQFLNVDGELWCCHCERQAPFAGVDQGRFYALASVSWQYLDDSLSFPVPVVNGPTTSLQPLPSVYTGYRNIASEATVDATNVAGDTLKYLTDGMMVVNGLFADREFAAKENATTITLTYDQPVSVRGIFLYNSYTYANTFRSVSKITFTLAESPSWHSGTATECVITDLPYNVEAYTISDLSRLQAGSAALATFDEIKVSKIVIEFDEDDMLGDGEELRLSELVVLGK